MLLLLEQQATSAISMFPRVVVSIAEDSATIFQFFEASSVLLRLSFVLMPALPRGSFDFFKLTLCLQCLTFFSLQGLVTITIMRTGLEV
jgi:hypothetical protein